MEYRELKNYPFYFAGSDGYIYSKRGGGHYPPSYDNEYKKLKGGKSSKGEGYLQVSLPCQNSKFKSKLVHRLIAEAFIGEIPKGLTVSHLDGNMYNNLPNNLKIESYSENHKRKYEHGTMDKGYTNSRAVLNKEQYEEVLKHLSEKVLTHEKIGNIFNVQRTVITKINCGNRYNY